MEVNHPSGDSDQKAAVMGDLLKEIQHMSPEAADALKQAGLETDSDIQSLTREDLHDLLPGAKDFKLRKNVFEMIQKSRSPNMPPKELVELQNNSATCAVMGDLLKEIQIMSPEAADVLKQAGFETDSDIRSLTREDLNELLPRREDLRLRKKVFDMIHILRPGCMLLKELEELQNDLATSAQIDPGVTLDHITFIKDHLVIVQVLLNDNVDLLRTIKTRQLDSKAEKGAVMGDLLKEIQIMSPKAADVLKQEGFETDSDIQSLTREDLHELLRSVEAFKLRKKVFEMIQKSSLLKSPEILPNDNVDPLKNNNTRQLESNADNGSLSTIEDHPQGAQGDSNAGTSPHDPQEVTVKYKMVVGGQTFGAHTQLMDQVNHATKGNVQFLENSQDRQIIIVFCPITSRVESDVKAAMTGVPGDKPIILVKMHHVCESKSSLCFNTSIDDRNIVLQVNVFFHENFPGLLKCTLNENAVSEIKQELLKHSVHRSKDTRASTSDQGSENQAKRAKKNA